MHGWLIALALTKNTVTTMHSLIPSTRLTPSRIEHDNISKRDDAWLVVFSVSTNKKYSRH